MDLQAGGIITNNQPLNFLLPPSNVSNLQVTLCRGFQHALGEQQGVLSHPSQESECISEMIYAEY